MNSAFIAHEKRIRELEDMKRLRPESTPFVLVSTGMIRRREALEAIIEYAEIERCTKPKRDTKGFLNRLTESAACAVGGNGLVPKHRLSGLKNMDLIRDFTKALGGYGRPLGWRALPRLGAQGIYKSRYGWIAWRIGACSNDYEELCGRVSSRAKLATLSIIRSK